MEGDGMTDERQVVHDYLKDMADSNRLSARNVVDEARNKKNALHAYFEWDDAKAADRHRLDQARRLISSFEIVMVRNEKSYRVQEFVESTRKPEDKQGYVSLDSIVDDRQAARDFIEREMQLAENYVAKCVDFAAVLDLTKRVEGLIEDIQDLRSDIRNHEQPSA
jgi:hypothetical protein